MAQSVEHIVHIDGVTGSSPVATTMSKSGKLLVGLFLFLSASSFTPMEVQSRRPLCGIQADLNGSSPVATTMSKLGKLLAGLFLSASSFAPMEVQSRRPLCGIQANLNGSSPVLCTKRI